MCPGTGSTLLCNTVSIVKVWFFNDSNVLLIFCRCKISDVPHCLEWQHTFLICNQKCNDWKSSMCFSFLQKVLPAHYLVKKKVHYTRRITPKHVTNGGTHLRGLAPRQHSSEESSQRWQATGGTEPDLPVWEVNPRLAAPLKGLKTTPTDWKIWSQNSTLRNALLHAKELVWFFIVHLATMSCKCILLVNCRSRTCQPSLGK